MRCEMRGLLPIRADLCIGHDIAPPYSPRKSD